MPRAQCQLVFVLKVKGWPISRAGRAADPFKASSSSLQGVRGAGRAADRSRAAGRVGHSGFPRVSCKYERSRSGPLRHQTRAASTPNAISHNISCELQRLYFVFSLKRAASTPNAANHNIDTKHHHPQHSCELHWQSLYLACQSETRGAGLAPTSEETDGGQREEGGHDKGSPADPQSGNAALELRNSIFISCGVTPVHANGISTRVPPAVRPHRCSPARSVCRSVSPIKWSRSASIYWSRWSLYALS